MCSDGSTQTETNKRAHPPAERAAMPQAPRGACSDTGQRRHLPVEAITLPSPGAQVQHIPSPDEIERFASTLRETGELLHPLTVRPTGAPDAEGPTYELVCGRLRLETVRALGWSSVPCLIMDLGDEAARKIGLLEDVSRKTVHQLERAWKIEDVLCHVGGTQQDLAAMISLTPGQVSEALAFAAALPRDVINAVAEAAGTDPGRLASLSRSDLRRLRSAAPSQRRTLLEHAAREVARGRKSQLPPRKSSGKAVKLAGGAIRVDRARLRDLGRLAAAWTVVRTVLVLLRELLLGSRIFAILRGANNSADRADE